MTNTLLSADLNRVLGEGKGRIYISADLKERIYVTQDTDNLNAPEMHLLWMHFLMKGCHGVQIETARCPRACILH